MKIPISLKGGLVVIAVLVTLGTTLFLQTDTVSSKGDEDRASVNPTSPKLEEDLTPPRLKAVNLQWGFVTVEEIESFNLAEDSELEVVRDGLVLGKLRVVSLEGDRALADIHSLVGDQVFCAGDIVR